MESVLKTIKHNNLIKKGEVIAVALSGGMDSMSLIHYLETIQEILDFEVVAVHIDHSIRSNSSDDADFVVDYCRKNGIRVYKFKVDALKLAKEKNLSIETAAREARYGIFDAVIKKGIVDKIATAHHTSDQAETILLRIFRGSGVYGAKGMGFIRDNVFIRPMLNTSKKEIEDYIHFHDIPFVQDETNFDDSYNRNYIRNQIIPLIEKNWPNVVNSLVSFGKACADDNEYIDSHVILDALIISDKTVKIPLSYFVYPNAIVTRILFKVMNKIGVIQDFERKHIELIINLAKNGENGSKLNLPFEIVVYKEYEYITITNRFIQKPSGQWKFKMGQLEIEGYGTITAKRTLSFDQIDNELMVDIKKIPKNAIWRFRQEGDTFEKFGGGTKKLKSFLIDKRVPLRERDNIPVLAVENRVLVVAGIEISESVRIDKNTQSAYRLSFKKLI